MPITSSEIKYYYASGQTALSNQTGSKTTAASGGNISTTEITDNVLNNLFDDITGDESAAGVVKVAKIFVKNINGSITLQSAKAWIQSLTPGADNEISIALGTATDTSAPASGNFSSPTTKSAGLSLGNIASTGAQAIWVKWTIDAGTTAKNSEAGTLRCEGDTVA